MFPLLLMIFSFNDSIVLMDFSSCCLRNYFVKQKGEKSNFGSLFMASWAEFNCRRNFNEFEAHGDEIICQFKALSAEITKFN